jgi:ankyrin repeat protein
LAEHGEHFSSEDEQSRVAVSLTPFQFAATRNNVEAMKFLVAHGANVNLKNHKGNTALHEASKSGKLAAIDFLLKHDGVHMEAENNDRDTALHCGASYLCPSETDCSTLARSMSSEMTEVLLEHGANAHAKNQHGLTALHIAAEKGDIKMAKLLVEHGADVMDEDLRANDTPLHFAASKGRAEVTQWLLLQGANVHVKNRSNLTPLHMAADAPPRELGAAIDARVAVMEALVEHGAQVQDSEGETPLHIAASKGHEKLTRWLLENGSDVHALNSKRCTPFRNAAVAADVRAMEMLLEYGADVMAADSKGCTALHIVASLCEHAKHEHMATMEWLLQHGADMTAINCNGYNALAFARRFKRSAAVDWLRTKAKELEIFEVMEPLEEFREAVKTDDEAAMTRAVRRGVVQDSWDMNSAVMCAVSENRIGALSLLYMEAYNKVDVDAGGNPIRLAASKGHVESMAWLVERGADVALQDKVEGSTALHIAAMNNRCEAVVWLLQHGAHVTAADHRGNRALHYASLRGHTIALQTLFEHGAKPNAENGDKNCALHFAARAGLLPTVKLLVMNGADVLATNRSGQTALACAALESETAVIEYLLAREEQAMKAAEKVRREKEEASDAMARLLLEDEEAEAGGGSAGKKKKRKKKKKKKGREQLEQEQQQHEEEQEEEQQQDEEEEEEGGIDDEEEEEGGIDDALGELYGDYSGGSSYRSDTELKNVDSDDDVSTPQEEQEEPEQEANMAKEQEEPEQEANMAKEQEEPEQEANMAKEPKHGQQQQEQQGGQEQQGVGDAANVLAKMERLESEVTRLQRRNALLEESELLLRSELERVANDQAEAVRMSNSKSDSLHILLIDTRAEVQRLTTEVARLAGRVGALTAENKVLVLEARCNTGALSPEYEELQSKFELLEQMYQPVQTENEQRKEMLFDLKKAALDISKSRMDLELPTKRMGELDSVMLNHHGVTVEAISLLQGVVTDPNFHPWRTRQVKEGDEASPSCCGEVETNSDEQLHYCGEVETVVNWDDEQLAAIVQQYGGGNGGRQVAEEVLRCNQELMQWNPSGGYCVTIPYHYGERRELKPEELLKMAVGIDVPGCRIIQRNVAGRSEATSSAYGAAGRSEATSSAYGAVSGAVSWSTSGKGGVQGSRQQGYRGGWQQGARGGVAGRSGMVGHGEGEPPGLAHGGVMGRWQQAPGVGTAGARGQGGWQHGAPPGRSMGSRGRGGWQQGARGGRGGW